MHRILMPDGSRFVYESIQQNAEPTPDSIAASNSRKRLSISSASGNIIPDYAPKVNASEENIFPFSDDAQNSYSSMKDLSDKVHKK